MLCVLHLYHEHLDHHSFPTRRSSDLDGAETAARIRELSGGGADVVVDASGFPETFLPSIDALRDGGTLIEVGADRKSTRLNSSHVRISYAVFCLKKKKNNKRR